MKKYIISALILIGLLLPISVNAQNAVEGTSLNIYNPVDNLENSVPNNSGSAAIGGNNTIGGNFSFAAGKNNVIGNDVNYGNAIGLQNTINANCSLATGSYNTINGSSPCSAVFGDHNILSGMNGFIVGSSNITASDYSMAFGENLSVSGNNSILFGKGYRNSQGAYQLENTINYSFMVGFNSTRPTFLVFGPRNVGDVNDMTGKIAIGDVSGEELSETDAKMIIRSDEGEDAGIILEPKQPETNGTFIRLHDGNHGISVGTNGEMCISSGAENNKLPLTLNGKIGINTDNTLENYGLMIRGRVGIDVSRDLLTDDYKLTVSGGILTDRVLIKYVTEWSDYVFDDGYSLMPLHKLRQFISTNRHLPDVPSETEVKENGIELKEMQNILLKKIEELTLYILQQEERISQLENELKAK
ncbi:MAG: hypothetical protein MJZ91_07765 [Bacteroidales bacterium]|nr:hypothetical protein [Bacteroidales bacterium]